ncbi:carboxymuconolactone decarboxylase family protein [Xanthobacter sediminis]
MPSRAVASSPTHDAVLSKAERDRYDANYVALFGGVSENARRRWEVTDRHGRSDVARLLEELRVKAIHESRLELKVQQLVHFGQLVALGKKPGAAHHAEAALKAGATVDDLLGVAETALLTGGVPAYSLGIEIISELEAARPR